jgi:dTMP kinase
VRALLLDPNNKMQAMTELLLYQAARVEHIEQVIRPALEQGVTVLCDRFTDATLAYQGYARGLLRESAVLNKLVSPGLRPDITLLFDLPARSAFRNATARKSGGDRLEQEGIGFQERVRRGYLDLARKQRRRIRIIRVKPTIAQTHQSVQKLLTPLFHGNFRPTARP